jgi:EAL domain-containing protein (putative c-di-GMP-specific phosphodiesterase class I)/GGDEF domain-containing protein
MWPWRALSAKRTGASNHKVVPLPGEPHELGRDDLLRWLENENRDDKGSAAAFALLVINLRRSDRAAALMQFPSAQASYAAAARRLSKALRPQDRFAQVGPEDVVLVLPQIAELAVVMLAVNRLFRSFDAPIASGDVSVRMRPCAGCALYLPHEAVDIEALLGAADNACALARSSENGFTMAASRGAADAEGMLTDLQDAMQANELEVWFQPQLDIASGDCHAAEALVRWHNKRLDRMIAPMLVVELAENNAMMTMLTTFVLNATLRQLGELRRAGIDLRIAINVSASLLRDTELPELVARALAVWSVAADRLTIEVTESAIMLDVERSLQVMQELKRLGVHLSIDDFGTGYSSLAYLRRMPLDELKIDAVFVKHMLVNKGDAQIVRSVIDLAHNFDLRAVAEGVEEPATFAMLASLGCDVIQGYHYARPMPSVQVPAWWAKGRSAAVSVDN